MTPASLASRTNSFDSAEFIASGFSLTMCFPAAIVALLTGKCKWLGVQLWTTSTSGSAISSLKSPYALGIDIPSAFDLRQVDVFLGQCHDFDAAKSPEASTCAGQ